jgi:hypothetical protein
MSAASLAGIATPLSDGTDLLPDLTAREDAVADRFKYREYPRKRLRQTVRLGRWKAYRAGLENPLALQGVEADPSARQDVSSAHAEVLTKTREYLRGA